MNDANDTLKLEIWAGLCPNVTVEQSLMFVFKKLRLIKNLNGSGVGCCTDD